MNTLLYESLGIGLKEGVKLALCLFVILAFLQKKKINWLAKPLLLGVGIVFLVLLVVLMMGTTLPMRHIVTPIVASVFGLFYLMSLGMFLHETGTDVLGPLKLLLHIRFVQAFICCALTIVYFTPDVMGSSMYLADILFRAGHAWQVYVIATVAFLVSLVGIYWGLTRSKLDAGRFFELPQLFLFLALVKLVAGDVGGFAEFPLIPGLKVGIIKCIHDMVHQTLLFILVPDHPLLSVSSWKFIGFFFSESLALWLSPAIFVLPLVLLLLRHYYAPVIAPQELTTGASRRKFTKSVRQERLILSVPVFVFLGFILSLWFLEKRESVSRLYLPEPVPVAAINGKAVIPINTPGRNLHDGKLHKFSIAFPNREVVRIMILKKKNGSLVVCQDACQICPPQGYGQSNEFVICLYCNTPIPIETLGKHGGCNPIPVESIITGNQVEIEIHRLRKRE